MKINLNRNRNQLIKREKKNNTCIYVYILINKVV